MKAGEHASRENTIFRLKQTSLGRASIHPIQIMKLQEFNTIEKTRYKFLAPMKSTRFTVYYTFAVKRWRLNADRLETPS
jgi:hypothetical protein